MKKKNTKKSYDVVSVGSAVRDIAFYTDDVELLDNPKKDPTKLKLIGFEYGAKVRSDKVMRMFGGGAANTSVGISRLGLRNAVLVSVGMDAEGHEIVAELTKNGVSGELIQYDKKHPTGSSFLVVEEETHEHVAFASYGANSYLNISPKVLNSFKTDWFYISSISMVNWYSAILRLVNSGSKVAWNPGATQLAGSAEQLKKLIKKTTLLILNKDEATELALRTGMKRVPGKSQYDCKVLAQHIHDLGPELVMVTDGRKGSHVFDGAKFYFSKPAPDRPVDTTGAGDCFGSSFTTGLIKFSGDIDKSLALAVINSTNLVAHTGAQQGLLKWDKIRTLLK
ncbi:MAG: carbohydrate kinase family protein [bacterium]|nr:carbohydrate kinase family protein [bacterium]